MWHNILGNTANCGSVNDCLTNTGADGVNFLNLQPDDYWSGWCCSQDDGAFFSFRDGYQGNVDYRNEIYAWAVRSGDVALVPEPSVLVLLISGLAGIVGIRRRCC